MSFGQNILHLDSTASINLLVAMNAANLPGRLLPNLISDACIGPLNTMIPLTFLTSALVFLWIGSSTHTSLLLVACFYGFAAAGVQSLYTTTIFSLAGSDRSKVGIRMGMVFAVIGFACLTGAPLGGQLVVKDKGQYLYAQIFAGTSIAVGGCMFLAARLAKSGWAAMRV